MNIYMNIYEPKKCMSKSLGIRSNPLRRDKLRDLGI